MAVYSINGIDLHEIAYDTSGNSLLQAYDINGNELFYSDSSIPIVKLVTDSSTGAYTGYHLNVQNVGNEYKMYEIADVSTYDYNLQSFAYSPDTERFYEFDESHRIRVYSKTLQYIELITNNDLNGHCNDATYYNNKFYFPDGDVIDGVYWWNPANNTVGRLPVYGIQQPQNGSTRKIAGICKTESNDDTFYLICGDFTDNSFIHNTGDKLSIYLYNLTNNTAVLQTEFDWTDRYIQGACVCNGILYVICNIMNVSGTPYAGIVLRPYVVSTWEILAPLFSYEDYEPEGINVYPLNQTQTPELMFGIGKYQSISKIVKCTAPYRLTF